MKKEPYYILGMDPGIASCGFALIDTANQEIVEMGVHLFSTPQRPKDKVSLAKVRRNARSMRRNIKRRKDRKTHCFNLFSKYRLIPATEEKSFLQSKKGDKPVLELRVHGLDNILSEREFAQVLYNLASRRGYIPHGLGEGGDSEDESKKVLSAINENREQMTNNGYRTIGELFFHKGKSRNRSDSYELCVSHADIVSETQVLFQSQRKLGSQYASNEFQEEFLQALSWEKIDESYDKKIYNLVGPCSYFEEEKRAAKCSLSNELCCAYEKFGHIVLVDAENKETKLPKVFIKESIGKIFNVDPKTVTYKSIRKALNLPSTTHFKGIELEDEKNKVYESKGWSALKKLNADLRAKLIANRQLCDALLEALVFASSFESLKSQLMQLPFSREEVEELVALPFSSKIFKGYGSRSLKALNILLDAFEDEAVVTLTDAEFASGLQKFRFSKNINPQATLLVPYSAYDSTCKNPVVLRSLSRMRKIINAIIRQYGVPAEIHIEVGTELKQSKKEKKLISKRMKQNAENNKKWSEIIAGIKGVDVADVTRKDLIKYSLWEEQNNKDIYTDAKIELERLFTEDKYCEIDHILPYSRTADDSIKNKALVLAKSNQDKKGRTPYEWMTDASSSAPDWSAFKARVLNNASIPSAKKFNYFLCENLDEETALKFINRNLNDTRYMSRAIKEYLEASLRFPDCSPKNPVRAISGSATGALRYVWGLNYGEGNTKDRSDNRHHAVDACVIAACSQATIQKMAIARSKGADSFTANKESRLADTQPWETFALDVDAMRTRIVPTVMKSHGGTGKVFEETHYSFAGYKDETKKQMKVYGNHKVSTAGNVYFVGEKQVYLGGNLAFLQLWLDKDARNGRGSWYLDPVYYADIPAIKNGFYIPRIAKSGTSRPCWKEVPCHLLEQEPIRVYKDDVLVVDGYAARFISFDINNLSLEMASIITGDYEKVIPTLSHWTGDSNIYVLEEDCLGQCYRNDVNLKFSKNEC